MNFASKQILKPPQKPVDNVEFFSIKEAQFMDIDANWTN
jgi:hypothetical protein